MWKRLCEECNCETPQKKRMADEHKAADLHIPPVDATANEPPSLTAYDTPDAAISSAHATAADLHNEAPADGDRVVHELNLRDEHLSALVGLELPFYATSIERVLETIGGMDNLQQTHETKSQFLPVKLRPTEPSCKPLFADLAKTQTILLRVRRRKRKHTATIATTGREEDANGQRATNGDGDEGGIDAEIVGLVREKYVCEGMADFQYFTSRTFYPTNDEFLPVVNSSQAHSETLDINGSICNGSAAQAALKTSLRPYLRVESERELEMIPEVFSKVDLPLKYEFRQRSGYQPTETAKKTSSTMTYLNFHDDVAAPAEPKPENPVVRRRPVGANDAADDHVLRILQEKLVQKPIWLRPKLFVGLDFLERRAARRLLRKLCYVFVDGPWRGSWIRMGYDPRKSADAAKYQVIELRNNRELVHAKVTHPSRKRTKKFSGINPKGPRIVKVTQTSENENAQAIKRRRKERFLLSETRKAYLADVDAHQQSEHQQHVGFSDFVENGEQDRGDLSNEWDSENDQDLADDGNDAASVTSSATSTTRGLDEDGASGHAAPATATASSSRGPAAKTASERTYEIFGVPLTSANVLFQLDEIDDDEVRAWTAQFAMQSQPTLLGGWFSTHMFLPLREIIRFRIAALVGRSKADLDTRRKRIEVLKKQALSEYTEQVANGGKDKKSGGRVNGAGGDGDDATAEEAMLRPEDLEQAAFEESLAREHAANERMTTSVPVVNGDVITAAGATEASRAPANSVVSASVAALESVVRAEEDGNEDDDDDDDDLEFDEEEEIQEEEADVLARHEQLQNGNDSGEDFEDDDDGGADESADDTTVSQPVKSSSDVSAPLTAEPDATVAAETDAPSEDTEPQVAMEYSF